MLTVNTIFFHTIFKVIKTLDIIFPQFKSFVYIFFFYTYLNGHTTFSSLREKNKQEACLIFSYFPRSVQVNVCVDFIVYSMKYSTIAKKSNSFQIVSSQENNTKFEYYVTHSHEILNVLFKYPFEGNSTQSK